MDQATQEFGTKAEVAKKHLAEAGNAAKELAQEKMDQMREGASALYEQGKEHAQELHETAYEFIREQPFKSVLIAVGVGLLAGMFVARK